MADVKPKLTVEEPDTAQESTSTGTRPVNTDEETLGKTAFKQVSHGISAWIARTFPGHTNAIVGGVIGIIVAVMIFTIGFLRTLFIAVCVGLGVAIGMYVDGDSRAIDALRRLFSDRS